MRARHHRRILVACLIGLLMLLGCAPSVALGPREGEGAGAIPVTATAPAVAALPSGDGPTVGSPPAPTTRQMVRYGDLKLLVDAGIYIALQEGYFAEQGLDVELITFDSAANMVAPLATNQLEAGGGALSAGLYNALRSGINESFDRQQEYFLSTGVQQGRVALRSFIDLQHAEAAVRQLGPYAR